MIRRLSLLAALLSACASPRLAVVPLAVVQPAESPAIALDRDVRQTAAAHTGADALWPGFDPLAVPLAVYDGTRTYLFRHPSPPTGFAPLPDGSPGASVFDGRYAAMSANTSAEIGGVATATVLLNGSTPDSVSRAPLAIHEMFHVFQRRRHPGWIGNEADLFVYPTDDTAALALQQLEIEALRRALADGSQNDAAGWARQALELRRQRFGRLDSAAVAYERGTELNEGLATYVEGRAAGRRAIAFPVQRFGPAEIRRRAYATGPALARLLDRFATGWPRSFEADDRQTLDGALAHALGVGERRAFSATETADAQRQARLDVAALAATRADRLATFARRDGWHLVVEAPRKPLWPQGFDPLNVERVGPTRVLHGRFLKLGNEAGSLEMLDSGGTDAQALTDGIGPHPIFNGISRVEIVGLPEPQVIEADASITVRVPGCSATFRGARLVRRDHRLTIRLAD